MFNDPCPIPYALLPAFTALLTELDRNLTELSDKPRKSREKSSKSMKISIFLGILWYFSEFLSIWAPGPVPRGTTMVRTVSHTPLPGLPLPRYPPHYPVPTWLHADTRQLSRVRQASFGFNMVGIRVVHHKPGSLKPGNFMKKRWKTDKINDSRQKEFDKTGN